MASGATRMLFRPLPILLLIALADRVSVASAQSITVSLDAVDPTPYATVSGHSGDSYFSNGLVGGLELTVTAQSGLPANYPTNFEAFCVELAQDIQLPSTGNVYSVVAPGGASAGVGTGLGANIPLSGIGADRAGNLEILYAHVFGATYDPSVALSTPAETEAFQLAVWKLSQDGGFDLTGPGNTGTGFWISTVGGSMAPSTLTAAQALLNWVEANPHGARMDLVALHSGSLQDLLVPTASSFTAIPEASNFAQILGAAVLGVALLRKRRRSCRITGA